MILYIIFLHLLLVVYLLLFAKLFKIFLMINIKIKMKVININVFKFRYFMYNIFTFFICCLLFMYQIHPLNAEGEDVIPPLDNGPMGLDYSTFAEVSAGTTYWVSGDGTWNPFTNQFTLPTWENMSAVVLVARYVFDEPVPAGNTVTVSGDIPCSGFDLLKSGRVRLRTSSNSGFSGDIGITNDIKTGSNGFKFSFQATNQYITNIMDIYFIVSLEGNRTVTFIASPLSYVVSFDSSGAINSLANRIVPILQSIETNTGSTVTAISSLNSSIASSITSQTNSIVTAISSADTSITQSIANFQLIQHEDNTSILNALSSIYQSITSSNGASSGLDNSNVDLSSKVNDFDNLEKAQVEDFNSNMDSLKDIKVDLFDVSDFSNTANWVSTQLTNIFNINSNIQNLTMFSLILGFAFVVIGIGVKK